MKTPGITHCPATLASGYDTYSPEALRQLFDNVPVSHRLDIPHNENSRLLMDANIRHVSISGVREKLAAVVDQGRLRLTWEGRQSHYIIKPVPDDSQLTNRNQMPANEHLTMQIARQAYGIRTADNAMIFFRNGEPAYITKRFDIRDDQTKIPQEDFASLMQKTSATHGERFKYVGSYADLKILFDQYAPGETERSNFFRLIIFNYLFANGNAHLKNFSLQQSHNGDYTLSPAYDLLNTSLHVQDKDFALEGGLFAREFYSQIYRQDGHPCAEDFHVFGQMNGLSNSQIYSIMQDFLYPHPLVSTLTQSSYLPLPSRRAYLRTYQERLARLNRINRH
ncbi:MAG: HipA domain-containing protein [Tannerellaceae bacterium]|jgi:serine/threonine-protein kinase HipA|nr:HipA domain-containing protein [Tannerellaceae bacterium]